MNIRHLINYATLYTPKIHQIEQLRSVGISVKIQNQILLQFEFVPSNLSLVVWGNLGVQHFQWNFGYPMLGCDRVVPRNYFFEN